MRQLMTPTPNQHPAAGEAPLVIASRVLSAACFAALLFVGWMLLAGWFHPSLEALRGGAGAPALLLYSLCLDAFALGLSAVFLSALDRQSFRALGLWFYPRWWFHAAAGAAVGAVTIAVVALAVSAWRGAERVAIGEGRLPVVLAFFLLAAAFEELMFRGYAWQRLAESLGVLPATLISSVLFGLAHALNPGATRLSICNTVLAGGLMCVARWRSRALWMPLGLHLGWNLFLGPVCGYPVSGYQLSGSAAAAPTTASDWLTGGKYGLEGSAVLTAVALASIVLLACCPRKVLSPADFQE